MKTKFILSFDCEGKWGIADKLATSHQEALSHDRLMSAYDTLLEMLEHYQVPATFAFVGLFQRSLTELEMLDWDLLCCTFPYVQNAFSDLFEGSQEGWDGKWALDKVQGSINEGQHHEIGSHGGTHTPFNQMDRSAAEIDLSLCPNIRGKTFIYPRNQIAHQDALQQCGVLGYRGARASTRISRIVDEFNIFQRGDILPAKSMPITIPAGYFINWKSGFRRRIPTAVSRLRYQNIFAATPPEDHVLHFWSHPENMASAPETFDVLEALLKQVRNACDRGQLDIVTQFTFCKRLYV